jgi:thiamine biosynthesis lipoprotein
MNSFQKEIKNEIMATDVFIYIIDEKASQKKIQDSVDKAFSLLKEFESKFSRFMINNELATFNKASGNVKLSNDLSKMIEKSIYYRALTNGAFDISILPNLINEGYNVSKTKGYYEVALPVCTSGYRITDIALNKKNKTAGKPKDLQIDLGGIGKGFAVDKVSGFLKKNYPNFLVDAGGDMFASGVDLKNNYPYWAVDIENPIDEGKSMDTLMITNMGVATSGVNRRKWVKDGEAKNHIINPTTGKSISGDILSVTVVAKDTTEADVLAKSLLIIGINEGTKFCEDNFIAAYFVDKNLKVYKSSKMNGYVWKE